MRGRHHINIGLLALALVLGAAILLLPDPQPERPVPAVDFEPGSVERIVLDRLDRDEALRFERRNGDWFVTAPVQRRANSGRVARALAALRERTPSCYAASEQEPAEFGLQPPQAELRLNATRIDFGYRAHDGRRYIRTRDRLCLVEDVTLPILAGESAGEKPANLR